MRWLFVLLLAGCAAAEAPAAVNADDDDGTFVTEDPPPQPTTLFCPTNPQQVLIFDFRSGWWDDYLYAEYSPKPVLQLLTSACDNVTVEYHHVLNDHDEIRCVTTSLEQRCDLSPAGTALPFDAYTQLWLLSGADWDGGVSLSGELFADFMGQTAASCTPVFIGAGDGNVIHANVVAGELGLGAPFVQQAAEPGAVIPYDSVTFDVTAPVEHLLFQDVTELADTIRDFGYPLASDAIAQGPYDLITPTLAIGETASRPFVLDAGVQRYYAAFVHPPTHTFLSNIVKLLAGVGCKAVIR